MRNRYFLLIDLVLFAVSVVGAFVLRLDWTFPRSHPEWLPFLVAVLAIKPAAFLLFGFCTTGSGVSRRCRITCGSPR